MGMGFDLIFSVFPIIFIIAFVAILAVFIMTAVRGVSQWNKNNHSPQLTVDASVVSRRANISHHHHSDANGGVGRTTSSTTYYVTFQVESGDRIELYVPGQEYGVLIEGDRGKLTFQGTRYLGFERTRENLK